MIRFLTDENFNIHILNGVRRRLPSLDILRIQDAGLRTSRDQLILEYAGFENRIVLSHDIHTMETFAKARLNAGKSMARFVSDSSIFPNRFRNRRNRPDRRMQPRRRVERPSPYLPL